MDNVTIVLLGISLVLFFGFFAEFCFRKLRIPDVLFLIILGFVIGPNVLGYVTPQLLLGSAPVFTTFTLLFLLFDGAFNIHLSSLIREFSRSLYLTLFNLCISAVIIGGVMYYSGFSILVSLLTGFMLGGVSSSFVIPILRSLKVSEKIFSLLTLESALTDVFSIVFSLTILELINLGSFGVRETFSHLASLFAVAGLIGVISGVFWIILVIKVFKEEHNYVVAVAFLILVYVVAQFLGGNGAISALFFGLVLKNSKQLSSTVRGLLTRNKKEKRKALKGKLGVSVTTPSEEYFYHQISFLLKTFFFVYIGILLDISDYRALLIGGVLSVLLMGSRMASLVLTKGMSPTNRGVVNSMFARGLAAAAVAQLLVQAGLPDAQFIGKVVYVVITGTIVLSSIRIFFVERRISALQEEQAQAK